jgi:hypothetical protein
MPDQKSSQATDAPKVVWDDSKMRSTYANVCNVASTREEVVLLFGTNSAWRAGESEVKVELSDRVILSPFAAKRLSLLLGNVVARYEAKFGSLDSLDSVVEQAASANKN